MELILASASPRRAEILSTLGIAFRVAPSNVEEVVLPGESPEGHAERLALEKALAAGRGHPDAWVLGGDTVVTIDGEILGKPRDIGHAVEMLLRLQGREHRVVSGLALLAPKGAEGGRKLHSGAQVTVVRFAPFSAEVAERYARTGEPRDKAGAYAIQGMGAALVEGIEGDYTGVVGLPVPLLFRLLREGGIPFEFAPSAD